MRSAALWVVLCCINPARLQATELFQSAMEASAEDSYQLTLLHPTNIELPPVSLSELTGDRFQSVTHFYQGSATASQGRLLVSAPMNIPDLPAFVRREIPFLWRLRAPLGRSITQLPLTLEWESSGALSATDNGPLNGNHARPVLRPWIQQQRVDEQGRVIVEGGIYIDFPTKLLQGNTRYQGRVLMTIEEF